MKGPPFLEPGKDEISFINRCISARSSCRYSRSILTDENKFIQAELHVIAPDDKRLQHKEERLSFYLPYRCSLTHTISATADSISMATGLRESITLDSNVPGASTCYHEIGKSTIGKASQEGALLAVRIVKETFPLVDGVLGTLYMDAGSINRHIITAAEGIPIYLDSPEMMDGSIHRGKINGSAVLDDDRRGSEEGSYTIFSTIESWPDHAMGYERHLRALLSNPSTNRHEIELGDVDAIAGELKGRFPYQVTADNSGVYPKNSPDRIRQLGVADCKDYVTLFIDSLSARGIYSTAVITSLKREPPRSLVVPDPRWSNHVVAYVPALGVYFDLAAEGNARVSQTSAVYGKLGFRTDTGDPVIVR